MKKLYRVEIAFETDIIVSAENHHDALKKTQNDYASEVIDRLMVSELNIDLVEVLDVKKRIWKDEWDEIPYGDTRTVKEIWKDIEEDNKNKAYKEWLEKYHMTFDFYKEAKNG